MPRTTYPLSSLLDRVHINQRNLIQSFIDCSQTYQANAIYDSDTGYLSIQRDDGFEETIGKFGNVEGRLALNNFQVEFYLSTGTRQQRGQLLTAQTSPARPTGNAASLDRWIPTRAGAGTASDPFRVVVANPGNIANMWAENTATLTVPGDGTLRVNLVTSTENDYDWCAFYIVPAGTDVSGFNYQNGVDITRQIPRTSGELNSQNNTRTATFNVSANTTYTLGFPYWSDQSANRGANTGTYTLTYFAAA